MKKIISFLLVLSLLIGGTGIFSSCSSDGEKMKNRKLVICNWGEYICDSDEDGFFDIIKKFEEETGIDVEYLTAETNETLYATMKAGGVNYDIIFPSDYMVQRMINEGMIAELDFKNIPNFSNIIDRFKNPYYDPENKYTVPYFWGTVGIIYNTSMVSEEVNSWDILWSDQYPPNMILMFNNPRDAFAIALNKLGYSMNTVDEAQIKEAAEELKKQKFNFVMDEFFELMPSGGAAIGPYYAGDYLDVLQDNEDLAFVRPESGTNIFNDVMCVPAASKNKDLAEQFINFMLRADVGKCNTEYLGYSTPNQAVYDILDEDLKNSEVAYPSEIPETWEYFEVLPDNVNDLMNELWVDIVSKNK